MKKDVKNFSTTPLIISNKQIHSLTEVNENRCLIDDSFIQLLIDKGVSVKDIGTALSIISLDNLKKAQFSPNEEKSIKNKIPEQEQIQNASIDTWYNASSKADSTNITNSKHVQNKVLVQRWRSAEEIALYILNANGFKLRDVSKQNLGYDLEGSDSNGNSLYIEVKSIEYAGQKFRMTNNEFAVAQYKPNNYYIALIMQKTDCIELCLIKDPINHLNLNRQCVQWVWECSDYDYKPLLFDIFYD